MVDALRKYMQFACMWPKSVLQSNSRASAVRRVAMCWLALAGLTLNVALLGACRTPPEVTLSVSLPKSQADQVAWLDIAAYPNVSCKTALRLSQSGFPEAGLSSRVSVPKSNLSPALGEIPKGFHAIVVLARTDTCTTIAAGCADGDTSSQRDFAIRVDPLADALACDRGLTCIQGRCNPVTTGANCSLALLGTSPLTPQFIGAEDQPTYLAAAPAITAVQSGFVTAYAEFDPRGANALALLSAQYIGRSGGAGPLVVSSLNQRCLAAPQDDSIALVTSGASVIAALSETQCPTASTFGGSMNFVRFDVDEADPSAPTIGPGKLGGSFTPANAPLGRVRGTGPHFLALKPGTSNLWAAELRLGTTGDAANLWLTAANAHPATPLVGRIGAASPATFANVSASKEAVLVAAINKDANRSLVSANVIDPARLTPGAAGVATDLATNRLTAATTANWLSTAVVGKRGYVVHSGATGDEIVVRGLDVGAAGEAFTPLKIVLAKGRGESAVEVQYADIAIAGSKLFLVTGLNGDVVLSVLDLLNAAPVAKSIRSVFMSDLRPQLVKDLRDGRVAIAATDSRVALVWITGRTLKRQEPLGSYAVFACEP